MAEPESKGAPGPPRGPEPVAASAARIRSWLFEVAFPFWADKGVDRHGPGFVEHLRLDGTAADVPFKRVRVQARQIYCFAQARELGWGGDALGPTSRAVQLLLDKAWAGPDRGWASVLTRSGEVREPTPDLYDIAFVLFALGWWLRVSDDTRVLPIALQTLDFLEASMRHPSGEGYLHRLGGTSPHLQNPHMHLTEAMLVLRDVTGHERFSQEADRLVSLCLRCFLNPSSGALAETFSENWTVLPGRSGLSYEPGHHYEWVWLLDQYIGPGQVANPAPSRSAMQALFAFALAHGQAETGLVLDAVDAKGAAINPDHRLWPQAERLKAWIAMQARFGTDAGPAICDGVDRIFTSYLDTQPAGTWIEYRDHLLRPKADKIPASSFYHLVLAFSEVLRHTGQPKEAAV